jgi:hypothetical protein
MNHKITQIFPVSALRTSGATTAVLEKELAAFTPNLATNLGGTPSTPTEFKLVFGSGSTKFGTFKTSTIENKNILSVTKTSPDLTTTQQVTYLGYDESSAATPTFSCDEEYVVTLKISEYWSKGIYQPMIQESVRVKTACCDTCSGNCDALDAEVYMQEIVDLINANPLLSKYVVAAKVGSGANWGVKLTGKALDEFGNECVPDAVPYVFNLVRFTATVHPGPYNTMDFDIEDGCAPWAITYATNVKYPIGAKAAMAEMERHFFANNLPATHEARRYWNPIYNNDSDEFLYVPSFTAASGFVMYEITYLENSPEGFEKKTQNVHSVIVLVESGSTNAAAIDTFMNSLFSTELTVNAYTTTQRDALVGMPIGTVIYNTTDTVLNVWNGTAWDATV